MRFPSGQLTMEDLDVPKNFTGEILVPEDDFYWCYNIANGIARYRYPALVTPCYPSKLMVRLDK
jgi:hypothetical protein